MGRVCMRHINQGRVPARVPTAVMGRHYDISVHPDPSLFTMLRGMRGLTLVGLAAASRSMRTSMRTTARTLRGGGIVRAAVADNPLLVQEDLPKFGSITADAVKPAVAETLEALERQFQSLEKTLADGEAAEASYEDVIEAMEKLEAPVEYAWGVVGHLMGVKNSDELRGVHGEMQGEVIKATTKLSQSAAIYKALEAIEKKIDSLEPAQARIVESSLRSMRLSGVGLEGEAKEAFNANRMKLADISTTFSNNVLDATKAFSLLLTDPAEVDGLPPSARALAASRAKDAGEEAATADNGPWKLGLDMPSYLPAMQHIKAREVREKLYRAFVTRAGEQNAPLIKEVSRPRRPAPPLVRPRRPQ